jgi:hypothetical protein
MTDKVDKQNKLGGIKHQCANFTWIFLLKTAGAFI